MSAMTLWHAFQAGLVAESKDSGTAVPESSPAELLIFLTLPMRTSSSSAALAPGFTPHSDLLEPIGVPAKREWIAARQVLLGMLLISSTKAVRLASCCAASLLDKARAVDTRASDIGPGNRCRRCRSARPNRRCDRCAGVSGE
eukprot:2849680-Prymnesium_polylepis.3